MAREVNRLTAKQVASITAPGRHADGGGLYLVVDSSGAKRWALLFQSEGKRRELGLGGVASVSLAQARAKASDMRRKALAGEDVGRKRVAPTFGEVARQFIADREDSWRNRVHRRQWEQTLTVHAAALWDMRVDQIGAPDVIAVLRPLWTEKPETATRLRGRIERILDAARVANHRTGDNPARWRGHLEHVFPPAKKLTRGHHAAMPYQDVPAFYARLRERDAVSARMLELVILTAARSGEVRGMRIPEVDLEAGLWTIPADRMKAGQIHRVPLTARAVEILRDAIGERTRGLVFPSKTTGAAYVDTVFTALYRRLEAVGVTTHGFRSSFKDWAEDVSPHANVVIEAALAHAVGGKVERAYRRSDAIDKRRSLLEDWAAFVSSAAGSAAK